MNKHPNVLSPTEMENGGFLGETTQVALVTDDLYGSLDQLIAVGIGPWQVYEMTPANAELVYRGRPDAYSMKLAFEARGFDEVQSGVAFDGNAPFGYFHNGQPDSPILEIFAYPEGFEPPAPDEWYPGPPPGE
jgi:methylmalonyl-CoA/ethylmalonyl-CoA epimerase